MPTELDDGQEKCDRLFGGPSYLVYNETSGRKQERMHSYHGFLQQSYTRDGNALGSCSRRSRFSLHGSNCCASRPLRPECLERAMHASLSSFSCPFITSRPRSDIVPGRPETPPPAELLLYSAPAGRATLHL